MRTYFVIHPGASAASRRYPTERFAQVASEPCEPHRPSHLRDRRPRRSRRSPRSCSAAHPNAFDLAGALDLGELAALIRGASVLISNNSGPVHLRLRARHARCRSLRAHESAAHAVANAEPRALSRRALPVVLPKRLSRGPSRVPEWRGGRRRGRRRVRTPRSAPAAHAKPRRALATP